MVNSLRSKIVRTLSPALCAGFLIGAARLQRNWPTAADATPFHARAVEAIDAIPLEVGPWVGTPAAPPAAAIDVLRPNVLRTICYQDPTAPAGAPATAWLSIVECGRAFDMIGHHPPRCYPAFGDVPIDARQRRWRIADATLAGKPLAIDGVEYRFKMTSNGQAYTRTVYNFMVAPTQGIVPDMKALGEAADDYRRRYLGAAQVQVVFRAPVGQEAGEAQRDAAFAALMRAAAPAIEVLCAGR